MPKAIQEGDWIVTLNHRRMKCIDVTLNTVSMDYNGKIMDYPIRTADEFLQNGKWKYTVDPHLEKLLAEEEGVQYESPVAFPSSTNTLRKDLLEEAIETITGDRNNSYGDPHQDFARTAVIWSAILGVEVYAFQVAQCMIALKLSRLTWDASKKDSWLDIAGYAACGYEAFLIESQL